MCGACASRRVHRTIEMKRQADPREIKPSGTSIRTARGEIRMIALVKEMKSAPASLWVFQALQSDGVVEVFKHATNFTEGRLV